ncbi:hypothetical protein BH10ACT3_BH10ACT3_13890 [soil metagenome]
MTDQGPAIGRTLPGRGAWLCPGGTCVSLAIQRGTLSRSLGVARHRITDYHAAQLIADCGEPVTDRASASGPPTM